MYWIVGADGMLGRHVARCLEDDGIPFTATDMEIDITDGEDVLEYAGKHPLTAIINCAAYTNVRKAEEEEALATRVNGDGVRCLAEAAAAIDARLVHVSTDYVFDGTATEPYEETAATNPLNAYGRSKLAGEEYLKDAGCAWTVVRTAWLFAERGGNFVTTVLKVLKTEGRMQVVDDQVGTPTFAADLARALVDLVGCAPGLYHFANTGPTSWYSFAAAIASIGNAQGLLEDTCRVEPITASAFDDPVVRPAYSPLATAKVAAALGRAPRSWQDALEDCLTRVRVSSA